MSRTSFTGDELVKRDVAIEIMAGMIGIKINAKIVETDPEIIAKYEMELRQLFDERDKMYGGNQEVIEKILTIYADEARDYCKK